ncbi:hypothetical protein Back2_17820 [Nocardioides baekrokdamisoli]|uniref:Major capsid protein n=1 Tax=Nocardioides baekrokdamisoli TaxID=1804624 RepID=A0A3G9IN87_9ACTN|nr:hypothetical protein [Nocardioides baekrokdamisoli]BBH17495.1 hypothetical protein Back2_17820 [Nocardioides baekrokdamisoli]
MANQDYSTNPSLNNGQITVDYLMNNPVILYRLLRTLVQQRLVGGRLLTGRVNLTGTGSVVYETNESIFTNDVPEIIDQLGEYPLTDTTGAVTNIATSLKRGQATLVSDELVARNRMDVLQRKLIKLANFLVFNFDSVTLSAIATAVTQTQGASVAWNAAGADQFLDLLLSGAKVDALNQGYAVDSVAAEPISWARLVASLAKTFAGALDFEGILRTGTVVEIAGLTLMKTTNLPSGVKVMVADSTQLGSIGWEDLGGGYQGDPSDPTAAEFKRIRKDENDGWKIQGRKTGVPLVQEPNAAVIVTGV